jgi:PAS domain S-box-containing protein
MMHENKSIDSIINKFSEKTKDELVNELVKLLKSSVLFEKIFESAPDALMVVNREGCIERLNKQAEKIFGYASEDVYGKTVEILIPDSFRKRHIEHRRNFVSNPHIRPMSTGLELYAKKKDGSEFPVDIALGPLITEKGLFVLAIIRDITESKKMENALRESETRYRMLFEKAGDAIFILEAEGVNAGQIISANHAAAKMHGYTVEELQNLNITDLNTSDVAEEMSAGIQHMIDGEWIKAEVMHQKKDGTIFPVEISSGLLELGKNKYFLAFDRDITERKQTQDKLRQIRDYLEKLIDNANVPIIVWNQEFRITRINHAFELLTGYTSSEIINEDIRIFDVNLDESLSKIARTLSGEYLELVEIPILCKNGDIRLALWNTANIYDEDGTTLLATIAQGMDITERKQMEITLEETIAECACSNAELEKFANIISHDLQEPLLMVTRYSRLLEKRYKGKLDKDADKLIDNMVDGSTRLQRIINDLLTILK